MRIIELEEVDSTNEYVKRNNFCGDVAVVAKRQTAGRGTKGRSFISAEGGLYLSVVRHYENFPAGEAFRILVNACVAVCRALEAYGLKPCIRWPNDVLVGGKKISGTLIENTFRGGSIVKSVVGIGVNVSNEIPPELIDIATSISLQSRDVSVEDFGRTLFTELGGEYSVADYKKYFSFLGGRVTVKKCDCTFSAVALDVCPDGRLEILKDDGSRERLSSAEVSLR